MSRNKAAYERENASLKNEIRRLQDTHKTELRAKRVEND